MSPEEMIRDKRRRDDHRGQILQVVESPNGFQDSHTGATVEAFLLIIEGGGYGLSYEVWEWAHGPDDEYGTGTFACILDGYGLGTHGKEMNFEGWRVAESGFEWDTAEELAEGT